MSSIYFVALPLFFGFAVPIIARFGKNSVAYTSTLMQLGLFGLALSLLSTRAVEVIAINPPLGISFVLNEVSTLFVLLFTFLMLLFSIYYLQMRKSHAYASENKFFILINMLLASAIGLVLSSDIFNIYVFFEIAGVSAYILSAYHKSAKALEAGIKYILTGMVASIFLVFGIALIYIHLGSLNLAVLSQSFHTLPSDMKMLISLLLLIGFGFKVEIFPLNFWVTDVYEGSSTLINALFSAIVVKAYLFVFFHIYYLFIPDASYSHLLVTMGAVSMIVAEVVALKQTNLKRVFAYSSLGQVGLMFALFALGTAQAITAGLYIVIAHSIAKLMIFLSITSIQRRYECVDITVLRRVKSPFMVAIVLIAMLSLLGLPPLLGFTGKFLGMSSMAVGGEFALIAVVLVASLIESIYYFKIAGGLLHKSDEREPLGLSLVEKLVFALLALLLIVLGSAPWIVSESLHQSAKIMLDSALYSASLLGGTI